MEVDSTLGSVSEETTLVIQHDWDSVANSVEGETKETFFVGYARPGAKTQFVDVNLRRGAASFDINGLHCERQRFNSLNVRFTDVGIQKTFFAPQMIFDEIHKGPVDTLDVSASGNLATSADSTSGLLVWNTSNGEILRILEGHIMDVNCCRFFPSGMVILSGGMDMTVRIWSVESGECPRILKGHTGGVTDLEFLGEKGADVLSASKDGTIRQWNCGSGWETKKWTLDSAVTSMVKQNEETVVAGTNGGRLSIVDLRSATTARNIHKTPNGSAISAVSVRNDTVFVGDADGNLCAVDLRNGTPISTLRIRRGRIERLFSHVDALLVASADGSVAAYKDVTKSPQSHCEFTGADCDPIYAFALTESALYTGCRDRKVRRYALSGVLNG